MSHSVGQVARFAGVTVRTLHHYDDVGLLSPGERTYAGHRRYTDADLDRLQRILFYRELGFPLEEIAVLLDDPATDPVDHLRRQHGLLTARIDRLRGMAAAVERAMEAKKMGIDLSPEEKLEVFGGFDPDEHAEEAERRWGGSDAYRESQRRVSGYTKEDWLRIREEQEDWSARLAALVDSGADPEGGAAMDLAEEARQHICRHYYELSPEMHTHLAQMYVSDDRFRRNYDDVRPGMARFLHDAILANAVRQV